MGELQRVVELSPAFSCCENYVHYISGSFGGELQGMGGGSTHTTGKWR